MGIFSCQPAAAKMLVGIFSSDATKANACEFAVTR
jgi:hypothetical protein